MTSEPSALLEGDALRLRRSSTAEQAADVVRGLILRREVDAGAPLRETQLAAALGISRNTMREALRMLAREGLVAQDRHRVATVAPFEVADVHDIFAVRRLLEGGAADLLGARGAKPDLSGMRASVAELRRVREVADWQTIVDADQAFHQGLVALADSPRLSAAYAQLEGEIRRCLSVTTRAHRVPEELYEQHSELLDHLEAGRYERFKEVLGAHLTVAETNIARVLRGDEAPPSTPQRSADGAPGVDSDEDEGVGAG
jgi:DNA-binding GntR family transcriptional regulator